METPHPVRQPGRVIDLMEALKKSLGAETGRSKRSAVRRKKRSSRS
jgi:non-homologous end joining protein Ku